MARTAAAVAAHEPAALHAELVYLPVRGRHANVAVRPSVFKYEVVSGTTPGVGWDHVIPLSDLEVGIDGDRFFVRWPAMPGILQAHAGHMLNAGGAPAAVRLLEAINRGPRPTLRPFTWGSLSNLPFLPRVQAGNLILAPAQWRIDAELRDSEIPPDADDFAQRLARWRERRQVPARVYLTQGDNRLLLDLDLPLQVRQLGTELRGLRDGAILLQEPLPGPEHAWLPGPGGHHLCELVVSLVRSPSVPDPAPSA